MPAGDPPRSVTIIANPRAAGGRSDLTAYLQALAGRGVTTDVVTPPSASTVADAIRSAGGDRVLLAGGDGLVHLAIDALAESRRPFGLLPAGTGNDFARGLGISGRPGAIVHRALGPTTPTDALRCTFPGGNKLVASVATAGFSAQVNELANELRWPRGSAKYTLATLRLLRRLDPRQARFAFGETERRCEVSFFAVANTGAFGGGMRIAPDAVVDDKLLDLVVVKRVSPVTLASVLPLVFLGLHTRHPAVSLDRAERIEIDIPTGWSLRGDGELVLPASEVPVRVGFDAVHGCLHLARP